MLEDEILKWKFNYGSRDALCRIYEKYQDYLLTLALALLNDVNLAEDVLHDVFVNFAQSAKNFRLPGSLKGYLAACIINRARDRIRTQKRQPRRLDDSSLLTSDADGPELSVIGSEQSIRLNNALAQLPYPQREAVILHHHGAMKFREIAQLQGVSVNTAQGHYRYGLNKLRTLLNSEYEK